MLDAGIKDELVNCIICKNDLPMEEYYLRRSLHFDYGDKGWLSKECRLCVRKELNKYPNLRDPIMISWNRHTNKIGPDTEEKFVGLIHKKLKLKYKNLLTIIIPRHINRIDLIKDQLNQLGLKTHLHEPEKRISKDTDIYLVNSYGQTKSFFSLCKNVFLGGSLIKHGGQNPLEAVKLNCKIIHGPNIGNFKDIFKTLKKLKLSSKFNTYQQGYKIVEKSLRKSKISKNSKNLLRYGDKILNNVHSEVSKFIK